MALHHSLTHFPLLTHEKEVAVVMSSSEKNEKSALQLTKYQTIEDNILGGKSGAHYKDDSLCDERMPWYLIASFVITMLALSLWFLSKPPMSSHVLPVVDNSHAFDTFGRYIMHNYDEDKPMADFLPALGGIWGYPMWAFYVNRGQGITAFGINNKDGGIAKFNTAEKGNFCCLSRSMTYLIQLLYLCPSSIFL